ncbi:UNVERIFIED_CONTAM: hypothetical protein HDU68_008139 [Siphonaria sp. JEL0065]|nr:hypothetical protein HDU68_008139 [Siphonaria sp. JEL0065]
MRESLKTLEEQNRRLHFEKAALVSTLIDIKPPPIQPTVTQKPSLQQQQLQQQQQQQSSSAFLRGSRAGESSVAPNQKNSIQIRDENSAFESSAPLYQQQSQYPQPTIKDDTLPFRRQSLEIESLNSQCTILASENKRLRARTMELETLLLTAVDDAQTPPTLEKLAVDECVGTQDDFPPLPSLDEILFNSLKADFNLIIRRKQDIVQTLDRANLTTIDASSNIPSSMPLSDVIELLDTISDAFLCTLTNRTLPSTTLNQRRNSGPTISPSPPGLSTALTILDKAITHYSKNPPKQTPPQIPQETLKLLTDLSTLYISELDSFTALKQSLHEQITNLHTQMDHLAQETALSQKERDEWRQEAIQAQDALSAKLAEPPIVDPDTIAVDVKPYLEKMKKLEFECNRLKGVEVTLEGLISEWKSENEVLRRMVDELSGTRNGDFGAGTREDVGQMKREAEELRVVLEDERLKYAKAREVIRVLKGVTGDEGETGDRSLDVEGLAMESGLKYGDKQGLSSHAKALHDTVERNLVDFDELVKVLGENTELKSKMTETGIRFEAQEKQLRQALDQITHLEKTLQTTTESHTYTTKDLQTTLQQLQTAHNTLTNELTRLKVESAHLHSLSNNYHSQFSRIELIASEWFDVKAEHFLQVEAQLLQQLEENAPGHAKLPSRLINFEGMFTRLLGILKEAREKLKHAEENVKTLAANLKQATHSEKVLDEKCRSLEKTNDGLKSKRDMLAAQVGQLEKEFEEETCLRRSAETKLRRVIKGSMALLDIPIDSAVVNRMIRTSSANFHVTSQSKSASPQRDAGRASPSRDFEASL